MNRLNKRILGYALADTGIIGIAVLLGLIVRASIGEPALNTGVRCALCLLMLLGILIGVYLLLSSQVDACQSTDNKKDRNDSSYPRRTKHFTCNANDRKKEN